MRGELIHWQWQGYPEFHRNRLNLWIHLFAVPAFIASSASLVLAVVMLQWSSAVAALVSLALAFGLQGFGHQREETPAIPFTGPGDAVTRIFVEQFVSFPRFVLSGGWLKALRASGRPGVASPGTR
ncbi:MAG: terminase [Myxococcales bacterium]|nr:terminase [Myxococcales bacterium]